jgi:hypothetical protein
MMQFRGREKGGPGEENDVSDSFVRVEACFWAKGTCVMLEDTYSEYAVINKNQGKYEKSIDPKTRSRGDRV